ncbi:MAG TPA: segregation/condensation protein A [Blastocatellia bacterium]|nr:segregation/condensation protein A [Blastocatellia bacterium]
MSKDKKKAATGTAVLESFEPDTEAPRDNYRVKLEAFEGPLDLLLYLIRKNEVDIYNIPIAEITQQYLEYLQLMQELDIAVAGDFLVLAATLIYIKSKMLLPPEPKGEGEEDLTEDPRAELVGQLLEYQKFKAAANMLHSRAQIETACFTRAPLETDKNNPEVSATVFDLLRVFREALQRARVAAQIEIHRDEVTMGEKLRQIKSLLAERHEINVREVFDTARSKGELILTFLVFLELAKEMEIVLVQKQALGDIFARKRSEEEKMSVIGADNDEGQETPETETAAGEAPAAEPAEDPDRSVPTTV